jgi:hypothetical protein
MAIVPNNRRSSPRHRLQRRSQVLIDKLAGVPRSRIGRLDSDTMRVVSAALAKFLGLD